MRTLPLLGAVLAACLTLPLATPASAVREAPTRVGAVRADVVDPLGDVRGGAERPEARLSADLVRVRTFHDDDVRPTRVYVQLELEGRPDDEVRRTFRVRILDDGGAEVAFLQAVLQGTTRSVSLRPTVLGRRGPAEPCPGLSVEPVVQRTMPTVLVDLPAVCLRRYASSGQVAVAVSSVDQASRRATARDDVPATGPAFDLS